MSLNVIENGTIRSIAYGFLLVFYSNIFPEIITAISTRGIENFGEVETFNVFEIFNFKNAATLKTGLLIRRGHWKCHHTIDRT